MKLPLLILLIFSIVFPQAAATEKAENPVEKITDTYYRIGSVFLEKEKREVYLDGFVNMREGMIEVLACGRRGKLHESVLVMDIVPHDLQVALLLLGMDHTKATYSEDGMQLTGGEEVKISVSWDNDGKNKTVAAEKLLYNLIDEKPLKNARWVFIGSRLNEGVFMADMEESLITTYHDPNAIIDNAGEGADNDDLLAANTKLIPAVGTAVRMTMKVVQ